MRVSTPCFLILSALSFLGCKTGPDGDPPQQEKPVSGRSSAVFSDLATADLRRAVQEGDANGVRSALACGADAKGQLSYGGTVLHQAVEAGYRDIVEILIVHGVDLDAKHEGGLDATPLHAAAESGHAEIADLLLSHGAKANSRDVDGKTPLHSAAWAGHKTVVDVLIARGADVNAKDLGDSTPLHEALTGDASGADIVKLLVARGANVNAEDYLGGTPLGYAMYFKDTDVVDVLLTGGARPDRVNEFDGTAVLHEAVSRGLLDAVTAFIGHGADVDVRDVRGQTPLHEAVWAGNLEMTALLIASHARVNLRDKNGDTPAHIAALQSNTELLGFLRSNGADMRMKNNVGWTPHDVLRSAPSQKMITLSTDDSSPYSVIVADLKAVRGLLRSHVIEFDRIWIPSEADVEHASTILRTGLDNDRSARQKELPCRGYILTNIDRYNREYAGFTKGKARYVICNMNMVEHGRTAPHNRFTSVMDGGCNVACVVVDLSKGTVVSIYPNFP